MFIKANKLIDGEDWEGSRKELMKIEPKDDIVLNRIGETYFMEDKIDEALEYFTQSIALDGTNMESFALTGIMYLFK